MKMSSPGEAFVAHGRHWCGEGNMRVGFYYHQERRLPAADPNNNPYGTIIAEGLERLGAQVEFVEDCSDAFLFQNRNRIRVLHHHWPHYDYYHDDASVMRRKMQAFVCYMELARELGYKLVWTAHNVYPHNRRHQEIDHECRLEICRLATAVIAHCQVAADEVRRTFGRTENLFVIPHPHFIGVYPNAVTREQARASLGVPPEAFVYGFFGSIQPYKGIDRLIDSFQRLPGEKPWLVIAGGNARNPEFLDAVRRRIDQQTRIILRAYDRAPSEDIALVMRASDVITLPFVDTLTSGTFILALSWGKPVVAPALGCLPATIELGAGIMYDPVADDALFQAMKEIGERDLQAASRVALTSVRRFNWDKIAAATMRAYTA